MCVAPLADRRARSGPRHDVVDGVVPPVKHGQLLALLQTFTY